MNIKQGDDEDLIDYLSCFRSERDVVIRLFDIWLIDEFLERLPDFLYLSVVDRKAVKKNGKKDKSEEKESHIMIGQSHVQVAWDEDEIVLDDDDFHVVFSG